MDSYPLVGANLSQRLFDEDEKLNVPEPSDSFFNSYTNMRSLSGVNSNSNTVSDMKDQMPSYLAQARMSTYYQDNPWGILLANKKFEVEPMGGRVDRSQPPGYRPGNVEPRKN